MVKPMKRPMSFKISATHFALCSAIYLINLIIATLLLLPSLVSSEQSVVWWLDNLMNLQLQWSLFAAILIVINYFFINTKLYWLLTLSYLGLSYINFTPLYFTVSDTAKSFASPVTEQPLTIAQLNLHYDNPTLTTLLPKLAKQPFTILVLQEVSDQQAQHFQSLKQHYPYSYGLEKQQATPSGMAIFSHWPIVESHLHRSQIKGGDIIELILQDPKHNNVLQLFSLHPSSPRSEQLWQARNHTYSELSKQLQHSPFSYQVVIGDFNSSLWSAAFKQWFSQVNLKNSALSFGYIPSWSLSSQPFWHLLTSVYIDQHLVSYPITILNKRSQMISGSDHRLIITQLLL